MFSVDGRQSAQALQSAQQQQQRLLQQRQPWQPQQRQSRQWEQWEEEQQQHKWRQQQQQHEWRQQQQQLSDGLAGRAHLAEEHLQGNTSLPNACGFSVGVTLATGAAERKATQETAAATTGAHACTVRPTEKAGDVRAWIHQARVFAGEPFNGVEALTAPHILSPPLHRAPAAAAAVGDVLPPAATHCVAAAAGRPSAAAASWQSCSSAAAGSSSDSGQVRGKPFATAGVAEARNRSIRSLRGTAAASLAAEVHAAAAAKQYSWSNTDVFVPRVSPPMGQGQQLESAAVTPEELQEMRVPQQTCVHYYKRRRLPYQEQQGQYPTAASQPSSSAEWGGDGGGAAEVAQAEEEALVAALYVQQTRTLLSSTFCRDFTATEVEASLSEVVRLFADETEEDDCVVPTLEQYAVSPDFKKDRRRPQRGEERQAEPQLQEQAHKKQEPQRQGKQQQQSQPPGTQQLLEGQEQLSAEEKRGEQHSTATGGSSNEKEGAAAAAGTAASVERAAHEAAAVEAGDDRLQQTKLLFQTHRGGLFFLFHLYIFAAPSSVRARVLALNILKQSCPTLLRNEKLVTVQAVDVAAEDRFLRKRMQRAPAEGSCSNGDSSGGSMCHSNGTGSSSSGSSSSTHGSDAPSVNNRSCVGGRRGNGRPTCGGCSSESSYCSAPAEDLGRIACVVHLGSRQQRISRGTDTVICGVDEAAVHQQLLREGRPVQCLSGARPPQQGRGGRAAEVDVVAVQTQQQQQQHLPSSELLRRECVAAAAATEKQFEALLARLSSSSYQLLAGSYMSRALQAARRLDTAARDFLLFYRRLQSRPAVALEINRKRSQQQTSVSHAPTALCAPEDSAAAFSASKHLPSGAARTAGLNAAAVARQSPAAAAGKAAGSSGRAEDEDSRAAPVAARQHCRETPAAAAAFKSCRDLPAATVLTESSGTSAVASSLPPAPTGVSNACLRLSAPLLSNVCVEAPAVASNSPDAAAVSVVGGGGETRATASFGDCGGPAAVTDSFRKRLDSSAAAGAGGAFGNTSCAAGNMQQSSSDAWQLLLRGAVVDEQTGAAAAAQRELGCTPVDAPLASEFPPACAAAEGTTYPQEQQQHRRQQEGQRLTWPSHPPQHVATSGAGQAATAAAAAAPERAAAAFPAYLKESDALQQAYPVFLKTIFSFFPGQTVRVAGIDLLAATLNTTCCSPEELRRLGRRSQMNDNGRSRRQSNNSGSSTATSWATSRQAKRSTCGVEEPLKGFAFPCVQPLVHCLATLHVPDGNMNWRAPRMRGVLLQLLQEMENHLQRLRNRLNVATAARKVQRQKQWLGHQQQRKHQQQQQKRGLRAKDPSFYEEAGEAIDLLHTTSERKFNDSSSTCSQQHASAQAAHLLLPVYGPLVAYLIVLSLRRVERESHSPPFLPPGKAETASCHLLDEDEVLLQRADDASPPRLRSECSSSSRSSFCGAAGVWSCSYQVLDCITPAAAGAASSVFLTRGAAAAEELAALLAAMLWRRRNLRFLKEPPRWGSLAEKAVMSVTCPRSSSHGEACVSKIRGNVLQLETVEDLRTLRECATPLFTLDTCGIILMFTIEGFFSGHRVNLLNPQCIIGLRFLYIWKLLDLYVYRCSHLHSKTLPTISSPRAFNDEGKQVVITVEPAPPRDERDPFIDILSIPGVWHPSHLWRMWCSSERAAEFYRGMQNRM